MLWLTLLIVHGLLAFLLLGAVTHQALSVLRPSRDKRKFIESFAAVRSGFYTDAVIVLFLITFVFGAWIYAFYRTEVRQVLELTGHFTPVGLFELKEHFLALALALLPTYWLLWKKIPLAEQHGARKTVTVIIAVTVWAGFLIGHIVNNAKGFDL